MASRDDALVAPIGPRIKFGPRGDRRNVALSVLEREEAEAAAEIERVRNSRTAAARRAAKVIFAAYYGALRRKRRHDPDADTLNPAETAAVTAAGRALLGAALGANAVSPGDLDELALRRDWWIDEFRARYTQPAEQDALRLAADAARRGDTQARRMLVTAAMDTPALRNTVIATESAYFHAVLPQTATASAAAAAPLPHKDSDAMEMPPYIVRIVANLIRVLRTQAPLPPATRTAIEALWARANAPQTGVYDALAVYQSLLALAPAGSTALPWAYVWYYLRWARPLLPHIPDGDAYEEVFYATLVGSLLTSEAFVGRLLGLGAEGGAARDIMRDLIDQARAGHEESGKRLLAAITAKDVKALLA